MGTSPTSNLINAGSFAIPGYGTETHNNGTVPTSGNSTNTTATTGTLPGYNYGSTNNSNVGTMTPESYSNLRDLYGSGIGNWLATFVNQGGGYNQGALNDIFGAMAPQEAKALATIDQSSGVSGTRFSSAHDYATSNYLADVYAYQGGIAAQEYDKSIDRMLGVMTGAASDKTRTDSSGGGIWDMLSSFAGAGADVLTSFFDNN